MANLLSSSEIDDKVLVLVYIFMKKKISILLQMFFYEVRSNCEFVLNHVI